MHWPAVASVWQICASFVMGGGDRAILQCRYSQAECGIWFRAHLLRRGYMRPTRVCKGEDVSPVAQWRAREGPCLRRCKPRLGAKPIATALAGRCGYSAILESAARRGEARAATPILRKGKSDSRCGHGLHASRSNGGDFERVLVQPRSEESAWTPGLKARTRDHALVSLSDRCTSDVQGCTQARPS